MLKFLKYSKYLLHRVKFCSARVLYFSDLKLKSLGIISKCVNPYNKEKRLLLVAGIRNWGTKAAIITFLKHFREIENKNKDSFSMVVRGLDLNSDGLVDDAEILE